MLYASVNAMQVSNAAERMDEVLAEPQIPEKPASAKPVTYDVVYDHVSFSYIEDETHAALKDVSFTAAQGKVTAIVGPSGGGKSTIASLLPRFYDVELGAIRIGGVDIRDMSMAELMDTVSFVFQDNFLFKQSMLDNIRMGRPGAGVLAEIIAGIGKFRNNRLNMFSYAVFSQNLLGGFLPIWIMRDYYFADTLERGMSADFCNTLEVMTPT